MKEINNSSAVPVPEPFCLLWVRRVECSQFGAFYQLLWHLGLSGVKRKQHTPVVCPVLSVVCFTKHVQMSPQRTLSTPEQWKSPLRFTAAKTGHRIIGAIMAKAHLFICLSYS